MSIGCQRVTLDVLHPNCERPKACRLRPDHEQGSRSIGPIAHALTHEPQFITPFCGGPLDDLRVAVASDRPDIKFFPRPVVDDFVALHCCSSFLQLQLQLRFPAPASSSSSFVYIRDQAGDGRAAAPLAPASGGRIHQFLELLRFCYNCNISVTFTDSGSSFHHLIIAFLTQKCNLQLWMYYIQGVYGQKMAKKYKKIVTKVLQS